MNAPEHAEIPLGRYYGWFTLALLVTYVLIAILRHISGSNLSGISMISPFFAASIASERFLTREQRVPSDSERRQLTLGNLGITLLVNAILLAVFTFTGALQQSLREIGGNTQTYMMIFISLMMVTLLVNYLLIRWAYGGIARKRAHKLGLIEPPQNKS